jgi:nitronate monooxygenase
MFKFSDLTIPVIQAPMAGGVNTPALVSAVSDAGGLGSFGFAYSSPEKIDADLRATKALIKKAPNNRINANFFVFKEPVMPAQQEQQQALSDLKEVVDALGVTVAIPKSPYIPDLQSMLEPIWVHQPEVLTFHFGLPPQQFIEKAHSLGISVGVTATSLEEALMIQSADIDFIVAQGIEAGGHRGIFDPHGVDQQLTVRALVQELDRHLQIPVVAAGGLMNGRDVHDIIKVGASAAQMGTAFLVTAEAGTSPAHRRFVLTQPDLGTAFTRAFSGRPAQGVKNQYMSLMEGKTYLPFPVQNNMTAPMRQWATQHDQGDYQNLWAGTEYARARAMSVAELMTVLSNEYHAVGKRP